MFLQGQSHGYWDGYLNGREIGLWVKEPRKQRNAGSAKWENSHMMQRSVFPRETPAGCCSVRKSDMQMYGTWESRFSASACGRLRRGYSCPLCFVDVCVFCGLQRACQEKRGVGGSSWHGLPWEMPTQPRSPMASSSHAAPQTAGDFGAPGICQNKATGQSHLTAVLLAPALLGVSSSSPHIACVHVKTLGQQCGPGGKCT